MSTAPIAQGPVAVLVGPAERLRLWCDAIQADDMAAILPKDVRALLAENERLRGLMVDLHGAVAAMIDDDDYRLSGVPSLLVLEHLADAMNAVSAPTARTAPNTKLNGGPLDGPHEGEKR